MVSTEEIAKEIQGLLAKQGTVGKPSAVVCAAIANMRDLVEVGGGSVRWRDGGADGGMRFRNGGNGGSWQGQRAPPHAAAPAAAAAAAASNGIPPPPVAKYQSKFKNSTQPVEDKILNNIILSKLNKFSPKTYDEIRDFLYQILGSGDIADLQEMIRDFMRLVFRKAAIEEIFCPLYAKLLCELSGRYKVILDEMYALQSNYLAIFDDVHETNGTYDAFVEQQKSKQFRVGYSQFLAELTALEILNLDLLNSTFQRILENMKRFGTEQERKTLLEEYSDCLVRMAKVLRRKQGGFFVNARARLLADHQPLLAEMTENAGAYQSLSAKTRFMLMDVADSLKGL